MRYRFHVIKDPVHGSMQFTAEENSWLKSFIDSEHFQRLRHIKQLGLDDWIFPGAVHTRFSHSLGACYVAGQIAHKLNLSTEDRKHVMIACLLHDIGHGPFSHTFEEIFYHHSITHEDWTPFFIKDYKQAFSKKISAAEFRLIEQLIMPQSTTKKSLLKEIVSSQLDADRLDYLLRDSHFCGVMYGQYDFRWLLHCLTIVKKNGVSHLGITAKGIGVVEQYLMARRLMIKNVYHHGKNNAAEYLLQQFLQTMARDPLLAREASQPKAKPLVRFLFALNEFNRAAANTKNLSALRKAFMQKQYSLYATLCDHDVFDLIREVKNGSTSEEAAQLASRLYHRQIPKTFILTRAQLSKAKKMIRQLKSSNHYADWQLSILQLPQLSYEKHEDPIWVEDKYGRVRALHEDSLMIQAMRGQYEHLSLCVIDRAILEDKRIQQFMKQMMA